MSDSILEVHKDDIFKLANKISDLLNKMEVTKEKESISIVDCISIVGEIGKGIAELNSLKKLFVGVDPTEKASLLIVVTIAILNSDAVSEKLSPGVRKQIEEWFATQEKANRNITSDSTPAEVNMCTALVNKRRQTSATAKKKMPAEPAFN